MAKSEGIDTSKKLVEAFKNILMDKDFKDIRIKDITDEADLFRATFYTYFPDKYALFDEILYTELFAVAESLAQAHMFKQSIEFIFNYFSTNRDFYRRAFDYNGPESCHESLKKYLNSYFADIYHRSNPTIKAEFITTIHKDYFSKFSADLFYVAIINVSESDLPIEDINLQVESFITFFQSGLKPFFE